MSASCCIFTVLTKARRWQTCWILHRPGHALLRAGVRGGTLLPECPHLMRLASILQVLLGLGEGGPLAPATKYFYQIGDGADAESDTFSFTMPPPTGPQSLPYRCCRVLHVCESQKRRTDADSDVPVRSGLMHSISVSGHNKGSRSHDMTR